MKQEKKLQRQKTIISKNRVIILFSIIALFGIFVISACGGDLPTNSSDGKQNGDFYIGIADGENILDDDKNFTSTNSNLPMFDINVTITNISYPANTYRYLAHFTGFTNLSYKDTDSLTKLWLSIISKWYIFELKYKVDNVIETFKFHENGDLYWYKNNNSILLKKFHGGTVVIWKGGDYPNTNGIGGVYTWAISRSEAISKGSMMLNSYFGVDKGNDGGGKKGKVEILVFNHGYSHTVGGKKYKAYALQSYNQPSDDRVSKYLGELKPEDSMPSLGYWDIYRAYADDENKVYVGYYY